MLAKKLKIQNIKRQREFIKSLVSNLLNHPRKDGNTAFTYVGYVFPEVIAYFEAEGFCVEKVSFVSAESVYTLLYVFTISDKINLTSDDKKKTDEVDCSLNSFEDPEDFCNYLAGK